MSRTRSTTRPRRPLRTAIAYHEAGHAVARVLLGLPVAFVTVVPHADTLGRCSPGEGAAEPDAAAEQIGTVAGDVALDMFRPGGREFIARHLPRRVPPVENPCTSDADSFVALALLSDGENLSRLVEAGINPNEDPATIAAVHRAARVAVDAAAELLERNWRAVVMVAEELVLFGTVDGRRVEEIVAAMQAQAADYKRSSYKKARSRT